MCLPRTLHYQKRTVICNNLGKTGDTIKYKDNAQLQTDEKMTPMLEDIVLLNAVEIIDKSLSEDPLQSQDETG